MLSDNDTINVSITLSDTGDYAEIKIKTPAHTQITPQLIIDVLAEYLVLDPNEVFRDRDTLQ